MGEEEAAQVVLQGGLRALVQCMNANRGVKKVSHKPCGVSTSLYFRYIVHGGCTYRGGFI